ncbi:MAG TPA: hypothetical protein VHB79_12100 [Polyangiaceae bacterium]|nr:hypothetical protein [Polyangiaceae bacterium]
MQELKAVLEAGSKYLRDHPEELLRALRNLLALRFGVPLDALRFFAGRAKGKKAPKDLLLEAVPPGLRVGATVDLMGTPVRAGADIFIERVSITPEELRFEIRLDKVSLRVADDAPESPIAALLRSGALDLSRPGNLAAYMPKRPALLVDAKDDRVVIDLMRHPKIAKNPRAIRTVALLAPLLTVAGIESDSEHLDVALRVFPEGLREAVGGIRRMLG